MRWMSYTNQPFILNLVFSVHFLSSGVINFELHSFVNVIVSVETFCNENTTELKQSDVDLLLYRVLFQLWDSV